MLILLQVSSNDKCGATADLLVDIPGFMPTNCDDDDLPNSVLHEKPLHQATTASYLIVMAKFTIKDVDWRKMNGQTNGKHSYEMVLEFE